MTLGKKSKLSTSSHKPNEIEESGLNEIINPEESIKIELKNRMLASGDWLRLTKQIREQLKGSSWEENLRCIAEARALQADEPSLGELIEHLQPIAADTVPTQLKNEIMDSIRRFVEMNVEADTGDT